MNKRHPMNNDDENRIYRQIRDGQPSKEDAYQAWLADDPRRQEKDTFVRSLWNDSAFNDALHLAEKQKTETPSHSWFTAPTWMAAAGVAFLAIMVTTLWDPTTAAPDTASELVYQTATREVQHRALADGSTADLNAQTKLKVHYSPEQRQVQLLEGEARFSVAKDANRPFTVETRQARMQALGTIFNVDQRGPVTELAVYEGRVALIPTNNQKARRVVTAGQRLTVRPEGKPTLTHFDPTQDKHWLNGWISVEAMPLSQLLIKLNRFASTPIQAGDNETERLLVTGDFELSQPDKNLQILATLHQLDIQREANNITLRQP